jgi:hypothetical protein
MESTAIKACGNCEHSTPSTVENLERFVWCTKRQEMGGCMEAVFLSPHQERECRAFMVRGSDAVAAEEPGLLLAEAALPSTREMVSTIPMAIPAPDLKRMAVEPSPPAKPTTADLFVDLFI